MLNLFTERTGMYRSFFAQLAAKNSVGKGDGESKDDEGYYHPPSARDASFSHLLGSHQRH
jgi:hypothetical protein